MFVPKNTRENIINALVELAMENPTRPDFSMSEIATKAGITRQAIYQKHFRNCGEIISDLRERSNSAIYHTFLQYDPSAGLNPFHYFADQILPLFYSNRKLIRCFYTTAIDPAWRGYIIGLYVKWGEDNYRTRSEELQLPDRTLTRLLVESTMAIVEVWIFQENPSPPEEFRPIFLRLVKTPLYDILLPGTACPSDHV